MDNVIIPKVVITALQLALSNKITLITRHVDVVRLVEFKQKITI